MKQLKIALLSSAIALVPGLAMAGGTAPAYSADTDVIVPVNPGAPTPFQGMYAGGGLSFAAFGDDRVGLDDGATTTDIGTLEVDGLAANAQLGYRWRMGSNVWGLRGSILGGDISDDFSAGGYDAGVDLNWAATLAVEAGRVLNDTSMLYGFGGLTYGSFDYSVTGNGAAGAAAISDEFGAVGYQVGFGYERVLRDDLSLFGEYSYNNFGNTDVSDAGGISTEATPDFHLFGLGVRFSF